MWGTTGGQKQGHITPKYAKALKSAGHLGIIDPEDTVFAGLQLCPAIDADVKRAGMVAQEPWIFVAENLPKNGKTQFNWRCCRPVAELLDYQAPFELRLMQVNVGHPGLP